MSGRGEEVETTTCIHDDGYRCEQCPEFSPETIHRHQMWDRQRDTVTQTYCHGCGAWLETTYHRWRGAAGTELQVERVFQNEVYELLYTKAGRRRLLLEALAARGWPWPRTWKE